MADTPETAALPPHLYACTVQTDNGSLTEGDPARLTAEERDETIDKITDFLGYEDSVLTVSVGGDTVLIPVRKISRVSLLMMDEDAHRHSFVTMTSGGLIWQQCETCGAKEK